MNRELDIRSRSEIFVINDLFFVKFAGDWGCVLEFYGHGQRAVSVEGDEGKVSTCCNIYVTFSCSKWEIVSSNQ